MATKKCCEKSCTATPSRPFSKEESLSILRVAYLLAAVDGKITDDEQAQFARVFEMLLGKDVLSDDVADFVSRLVDDGQNMLMVAKVLRKDAAIAKAFLIKVKDDVRKLAWSDAPDPIRAGFAVWLGMCCADGAYLPVEKASIVQIINYLEEIDQAVPNGIHSRFVDKTLDSVVALVALQKEYDAEEDEDIKECIEEQIKAGSDNLRYIVSHPERKTGGGTPKQVLKRTRNVSRMN